jgi:molybdate/tungstate transport system substrate-binding protein
MICYLYDMRELKFRAGIFGGLLFAAIGCAARAEVPSLPITIYAAGSLARPLRAALDSIAAAGGPRVQLEIMGSREILRALSGLGKTPDLIVSADADELEREMIPGFVTTSTTFARNRVVLAISARSPSAAGVTQANWAEVVSSGSLKVARADPGRAPLGYRTQIVWKLAEAVLQRPGLAAKLAAAAPASLVRGNESDLVALLESGDADVAWCYESLKLKYVQLGDHIDLGSAADSLLYMRAAVRVSGDRPGDSVVIAGMPIRYAMAVVTNGPDVIGATVLRDRLLDSNSKRIMRRAGLDVLDTPRVTTLASKLNLTQ